MELDISGLLDFGMEDARQEEPISVCVIDGAHKPAFLRAIKARLPYTGEAGAIMEAAGHMLFRVPVHGMNSGESIAKWSAFEWAVRDEVFKLQAHPDYLGDGAYIHQNGVGICLTANHHHPDRASGAVHLDVPAIEAMFRYIGRRGILAKDQEMVKRLNAAAAALKS